MNETPERNKVMKPVKEIKFVEEKKMTTEKKKARSLQRDKKHVAWDEMIVVEEPPQETQKEFDESFAYYKRTRDPKDPLYQRRPDLVIKIRDSIELEICEPVEEEIEMDNDDWFD